MNKIISDFIIFYKKFDCYETNSNKKDLKYGLGEMKSYYCKGDYIWSDGNGNITSKNRQEFKKRNIINDCGEYE